MPVRKRRTWSFEQLERRDVFAADLDAVRVDAVADYAVPGQTLAITATIANLSTLDASLDYAVEFRLSLDRTIDATDVLLDVVTRPGLSAASHDEWTQQVAIPTNVPHARYYVSMSIHTSANTVADNAIDDQSTSILYTSLEGVVSYQGRTQAVAIRSYLGGTEPILDNVPTWLVIHGRNSDPSSPNLVQLEGVLDAVRSGDQVLVLDWRAAAASGGLGGAGENYIKPVATWAAGALSGYGFLGEQLNVVGHSWGAYVGAELAERMPAPRGLPGQVNSIIAVDPAIDFPGGSYNPLARGEVDFARNSKFSWAFYAQGVVFGSATTAGTADESFLVTSSDHSKVVNVIANLFSLAIVPTARPATLGRQFSFDRLLVSHTPNPAWRPNSYNSSGRRVSRGTFEAVITAAPTRLTVGLLKFATSKQERVYRP